MSLGYNDFVDGIHEFGLVQCNPIYIVKMRLLDLVFLNDTNIYISRENSFVLPEDDYHSTLLIKLND